MSFRLLMAVGFAVALVACGPKPRPIPDAGDEDAGVDAGVDAGRARGDDPATGWSQVVPLPDGAATSTNLGVGVASAPDQFSQPLIAAIHQDPNGDAVEQDNRVVFTRWSGEKKAFEDLKTIEVVGEVDLSAPHRPVSIARDSSTGRIGIAYVKGANTLRYAFSDDEGANFSLKTVATGSVGIGEPALALVNGKRIVCWVQSDASTNLMCDAEDSSLSTTAVVAPISLAVDSAGAPGVAFFKSNGMGGLEAMFTRLTSTATPKSIISSGTFDPTIDAATRPSVTLSFKGTTPVVAVHLRTSAVVLLDDSATELWYVAATAADGSAWSTPVGIQRNGVGTKFNSTRYYQGITATSAGAVSIAANFAAIGTPGALCRGPKWATSSDGLSFMNCSVPATAFDFAGQWLTLWPHTAAKNTLIMFYDQRTNPTFKSGIVMWRQP